MQHTSFFSRLERWLSQLFLYALGIPFLLVVSGAFVSYPAALITRGREPWHTLLLTLGLVAIVFGTGHFTVVSTGVLLAVLSGSVLVLLLSRWASRGSTFKLENFVPVYWLTVLALFLCVQVYAVRAKRAAHSLSNAVAPSRLTR